MSCEKRAKPTPAEPWVPVAGLPLPGHGPPEPDLALEPADWVPPFEQLSRERLIEIAYQFHPQVAPTSDQTPQEFTFLFDSSPERIAMRNAQYLAWSRIETWRALVAAVRKQAPPGYQIGDKTLPGHDASYSAVLALPRTEGATEFRSIKVHMSFLVPFYIFYEERSTLIKYPTMDRWRTNTAGTDISPDLQPLLDIFETEIGRRYGYHRFDMDLLATQVPKLFIEGVSSRLRPTLRDALFSAYNPFTLKAARETIDRSQ